ncbi:hypothetical protein [Actinokineospora sp. NPDC004072]
MSRAGTPRYEDAGERLIGPDGVSWYNIAEWLEPDEVSIILGNGATLAIDWCEEWEWPAELRPELEELIVSSLESHRRAAGRSGSVILAPELWAQYEGGPLLVVLSEETAKRRNVISRFKKPDPSVFRKR